MTYTRRSLWAAALAAVGATGCAGVHSVEAGSAADLRAVELEPGA